MKKLEEGKTYKFYVESIRELPDGQKCYVLLDPNKVKHLLPVEGYGDYDIEQHGRIKCRVDKINCTGKIFLEPEHPYYKVGHYYEFPVDGMESATDEADTSAKYLMVRDIQNNEYKVPVNAGYEPDEKVRCRVSRIKQGRLYLIPEDQFPEIKNMEPDRYYGFEVAGTRTLEGGEDYFLLKDPFGDFHLLRKKYYREYGIKRGDKIRCAVRKDLTRNIHYLEPEHPFYRVGQHYDFEFKGQSHINDYPEGKKPVFLLSDIFNRIIRIPATSKIAQSIYNNKVRCLVEDIVKGSLLLKCD